MILIDDWKVILKKAWSVRFNVLAALFIAAELGMPMIQPGTVPQGVLGALAFILNVAGPFVRVLAQKELTDEAPAK